MKFTLLLFPLLFLSSCTSTSNNTQEGAGKPIIETSNPIVSTTQTDFQSGSKDFGSGFILAQTEDETILTYSGKTIKTWSHNPPKKVPFIWDEACSIVMNGFITIAPDEDYSIRKQGVWDNLTEKEKKDCMKEYLRDTIVVEPILSGSFFEIRQLKYENYQSWLVFSKNGNIQEMPIIFQSNPELSFTNSGISLYLINDYDGYDMKLFYSDDFSQLISKEEIPKNNY